jgi:hypothetical protein
VTEDDGRVVTALEDAERRFRDVRGQTHEAELDPTQPALTQLRKACRLLDACRVLRTHDGYHTSVIELSFGAIERTIQFYILDSTNDTLQEYQSHEAVYERGAELNLYSTAVRDQLLQLWRENRSATYYRNTVATAEQADAMFTLVVELHRSVRERAQQAHECRCTPPETL